MDKKREPLRGVLLLDEDGSIHEIYEHKKFVIERTYGFGHRSKTEIVFESNNVNEVLKEYKKIYDSCCATDDVGCSIAVYNGSEMIGGVGGNLEYVKKELEKYENKI